MTVFLYDEAGNLLSTKRNTASSLSVDVPPPAVDVIENYVVRVITDDGSVGVRYFSDHEASAESKLSSVQKKPLPIVFTRSADLAVIRSIGTLSDGIIRREGTLPVGTAFTNVGELHACS